MKFYIFLFLFFALSGKLPGQHYKLEHQLNIGESSFTTDPLGNIYVFSKGDLTRYTSSGTENNRYSSRAYGDISYVDASNPMKILVVFPAFSKAVLLDSYLAVQSEINLTFAGIPFVELICPSREGGFWIFDPALRRLRRMNDQLMFTAEGSPVDQVNNDALQFSRIYESGDWIILESQGFGILVFDRYGTYYKTILIPGLNRHLQVNGDEVLYKEGDKMEMVDLRTGINREFTIPGDESPGACRVEGNRIFIRTGNTLKIYSY